MSATTLKTHSHIRIQLSSEPIKISRHHAQGILRELESVRLVERLLLHFDRLLDEYEAKGPRTWDPEADGAYAPELLALGRRIEALKQDLAILEDSLALAEDRAGVSFDVRTRPYVIDELRVIAMEP